MSQAPSPGQAGPFDLPIQTVPEWLNLPSRGGNDREPWYYGFLEKYARVWLGCGVLAFGLFALAFLIPLLVPEVAASFFQSVIFPAIRQTPFGPGRVQEVSPAASLAARFLIGLVVIGVAFLGFLLPILLGVAYILLSVDAGRNLRAIRRDRPSL